MRQLGLHFIMKHKRVAPVPDAMTWVKWFEVTERKVAFTKISDDVEVSTVFLGLDHNHTGYGPPLIFETMIFGGPHKESQWRYTKYAEAEAGHERACRIAREENLDALV